MDLNTKDCSNNVFTLCVVKLVDIRDKLNDSDSFIRPEKISEENENAIER